MKDLNWNNTIRCAKHTSLIKTGGGVTLCGCPECIGMVVPVAPRIPDPFIENTRMKFALQRIWALTHDPDVIKLCAEGLKE